MTCQAFIIINTLMQYNAPSGHALINRANVEALKAARAQIKDALSRYAGEARQQTQIRKVERGK